MKKRTIITALLMVNAILLVNAVELREYEKIWEYKTRDKKSIDEFAGWWGNETAISRILVRLHVSQKHYTSLLDVGCGFCVDYEPFKKSCPNLDYQGLDISSVFVKNAFERGIAVHWGRVQEIPFADSSFEVVIARHLLEHLDSYQMAIKEMVRVASKEVIITFFSKPFEGVSDRLSFVDVGGYTVYQNRYSRSKLEQFLKTIEKIKSYTWQEVKNKDESILHILV